MELKQFKITVVPLRDKLLNYARRMTDDPSDAEDAVQEVMLKLWNLRQKLDEYRSIEAVAMTMTHHLCMDMWRANYWTLITRPCTGSHPFGYSGATAGRER